LEADDALPISVKIWNSNLAGIRAESEQLVKNTIPNLNLTLAGNQITAPRFTGLTWLSSGVYIVKARGTVSHNVITEMVSA
jgi:hypothetical protein